MDFIIDNQNTNTYKTMAKLLTRLLIRLNDKIVVPQYHTMQINVHIHLTPFGLVFEISTLW